MAVRTRRVGGPRPEPTATEAPKEATMQTPTANATTQEQVAQALPEVDEEPAGLANETKEEKFRRVVNYRLSKAIDRMKMLRACSNVQSYSYTPQQVEKVRAALMNEVDEITKRFEIAMSDKAGDEAPQEYL